MWNFGTRIKHIRYDIDNQTYLFKLAFTSIENMHHLLCSTLCSVFEDFLIIKVLIYFISSIFAHLQQRNFAQLNKRLQNWDHNLSKNNPLKMTQYSIIFTKVAIFLPIWSHCSHARGAQTPMLTTLLVCL